MKKPETSDWFEAFTGFKETPYEETRAKMSVQNGVLHTPAGAYPLGEMSTVTVAILLNRLRLPKGRAVCKVKPISADVFKLHRHPSGNDAVFQVASQFNCLEHLSPEQGPEDGVANYVYDNTQGPACALACPADLIYRNYFWQTPDDQANLAEHLYEKLRTSRFIPWQMKNGYAMKMNPHDPHRTHWPDLDHEDWPIFRDLIGVGILKGAQVHGSDNRVTQVFCSALPLAYYGNTLPLALYCKMSILFLEAAYVGTLAVAAAQKAAGGSGRVFLTRVGGGAFGNPPDWIDLALERALSSMRGYDLDVHMVNRP